MKPYDPVPDFEIDPAPLRPPRSKLGWSTIIGMALWLAALCIVTVILWGQTR